MNYWLIVIILAAAAFGYLVARFGEAIANRFLDRLNQAIGRIHGD